MKRITEAAAEIGVSRDTLRRWVREGLVPCVKTPRNRWFWTGPQLEQIKRDMGIEDGAVAEAPAEEWNFEE